MLYRILQSRDELEYRDAREPCDVQCRNEMEYVSTKRHL